MTSSCFVFLDAASCPVLQQPDYVQRSSAKRYTLVSTGRKWVILYNVTRGLYYSIFCSNPCQLTGVLQIGSLFAARMLPTNQSLGLKILVNQYGFEQEISVLGWAPDNFQYLLIYHKNIEVSYFMDKAVNCLSISIQLF